jgi:hypothetical protein
MAPVVWKPGTPVRTNQDFHDSRRGVSEEFGVDRLRAMRCLFDNCNESFNQRFSVAELVKLFDAYRGSEWDIPPDQWTVRQIVEALRDGRAPTWSDDSTPAYDDSDIDIDVRARAEEVLETSADEDTCVLAHWVLERMGVAHKGP